MPDVVIALSGGIGAGKAVLGEALAAAIDADRASFGAEVRRHAEAVGADPADVGVLQGIGQSLVLTDRVGFVRRVLAQRTRRGVPLVVEGLRHAEILLELRAQLPGASFRLVHVETPRAVRGVRVADRTGAVPRIVARYEADIVEEQSSRILSGDLPVQLQVARVMMLIGPDIGRASRPESA